MALFSEKNIDEWIEEYERAHQHPWNKRCHLFGIPLIVISLVFALFGVVSPLFAYLALGLFILGWLLQFVGHYFEQKPPEFLRDWRFLFVGLRWWVAQLWK